MQLCSKCKVSKEETEFHKRPNGKFYSYCKECHRAYVKDHYNKNKQYYIDKAKKQGDANRAWLREYKESIPCTDCGLFFPYYVTQFDHVGSDKKFNIGDQSTNSRAVLLREIAKCELVCANCHAERTHQRRVAVE